MVSLTDRGLYCAAGDFYIITAGVVEILLQHPGGAEVVVNRLGGGEYFGEIALLRGGMRRNTVRAAADGPVEVMALDRETFEQLVRESESVRREFGRVADARVED